MRTEYAVEIYNRPDDSFVESMGIFKNYREAKQYVREMDVDIDREYVEIIGVEYDEDGEEINRIGYEA